MQTPLGELRECCALHQQEPRGRGSRRKPRHLLEWGRAKLFTAWQPANAPLHACTAVSILALLQWLWRRGKTGRAIAALAELSGLRERRAGAWPICTGSLDAGSLWTTALTRAAAAAHISQGEAQLYRLVTRGCVFRSTDRFGRKLAASGVLASHTQALVRKRRMSQSDVWPFEYSVVEASSRYKQQFTASVKLHTSLARAIWDDLSANVPLQTGVFLLPSRTSLRLLPVLCMMHAELVSARPPAVLPLLSGAAHTSVSVSHSLSLPRGNCSGTACW